MVRHWQLFAATAWAVLAVGILLRSVLLDEETLDRLPVRNWTVANLICAFLCVWNLARWFQSQAARRDAVNPNNQPLQPNREAGTGYEYNPEFDFQKQPTDPKPDENRG
ncbi:hypothetical protein [Limnoglobus roseus]|uniref:Uncharacterized protein n=1 Tax=Limnoglobus roseus TaxID=2598579 RepID=A0A5C1AHQ7_9BACT|nr:hypothetical protein [Limnoglobus roseus]QEL16498.1 hypothetical protein PX52LOC_03455 [Limnoglobus roseus]